jgi:hypothetical protein
VCEDIGEVAQAIIDMKDRLEDVCVIGVSDLVYGCIKCDSKVDVRDSMTGKCSYQMLKLDIYKQEISAKLLRMSQRTLCISFCDQADP